jgi:hypothetical protein
MVSAPGRKLASIALPGSLYLLLRGRYIPKFFSP